MSHPARRRTAVFVTGLTAVGALLLSGCSGPAAGEGSSPSAHTKTVAVHPKLAAASGDVLGGTVKVTGSGLAQVAAISFGDEAARITARSDSALTVKVPAAKDYQPAEVPVTYTRKDAAVAKKGAGDKGTDKKSAAKKGSTAKAATAASLGDYTYKATSPVGKQMAYALAHWKHYNTAEYGDLNPVGGDCANFVSQTLVARGWKMNSTWYNHDGAAHWSPAWGYTPAMDDYFASHAKELGLERLSETQLDKVSLGDIGIFDWEGVGNRDHTMIVDRITHEKNGDIKVAFASHNNDGAYRDLAYTITKQHPGAKMHFWHFVDPTAVGGGQ